jgi:predicted short-subunit dehydrogenase-like oxidoreductase (DUF2520 family)
MDLNRMRIAFVGGGPVAATLARALRHAGCQIAAIASRDARKAHAIARDLPGTVVAADAQAAADASDLVFLTVSDDAIRPVCEAIDWRPDHAVVHCSGATEREALASAAMAGAQVGGFHPLQMFADPVVALRTLAGCTITIDADDALAHTLEQLCVRLSCRAMRLPPGQRALYHASAYYVGPFLIALVQEAARIWERFGVSERDALQALLPLLEGTVAAARESGLVRGMGGCVARGDVGTVERHLAALEAYSPDVASLYRVLAARTVPLGVARGTLTVGVAEHIRALLQGEPLRRSSPGVVDREPSTGDR